jgi:hypothetical protein
MDIHFVCPPARENGGVWTLDRRNEHPCVMRSEGFTPVGADKKKQKNKKQSKTF